LVDVAYDVFVDSCVPLLYPQQIRQQIILQQPPDKQAHLATCLDKLMADVGTNLEPKNRDKFTQNLTVVRHEYRSKS
jgi:exportin-7